MSTVRPNLEGFLIIRDNLDNLVASTGFSVLTPIHCDGEYLFQFLFSSIFKRQIGELLVGSNYPAINSSDIRNLKILVPPSRAARHSHLLAHLG
ncbi:MAG: restriction endonuclease subunit S [Ignavibacteria bacterium]|nr:restriction endonuclease subunit S [Ignavibacteria bacterium]